MKERPILFSAPMVRALLAGTKTQTRRLLKLPKEYAAGDLSKAFPDNTSPFGACLKVPLDDTTQRVFCPHGSPGGRLWVRETTIIAPKNWADAPPVNRTGIIDNEGEERLVQYLATTPDREAADDFGLKATPSIFMPRWACRIRLEITGVRVERLNEISPDDACAEGIEEWQREQKLVGYPTTAYARGWDTINGAGSWAKNPWVWVITFKRVAP